MKSIGRVVISSCWSSEPFRTAKCGTRGPSPGNLWRHFEQNEEKRTSLPVSSGVPATGWQEGDRGAGGGDVNAERFMDVITQPDFSSGLDPSFRKSLVLSRSCSSPFSLIFFLLVYTCICRVYKIPYEFLLIRDPRV